MKALLTTAALVILLCSCKKDKYYSLTEKQSDFANYSSGQDIKFLDTNNIAHTFIQKSLMRSFHEEVGLYGGAGVFYETYEVEFHDTMSPALGGLSISLNRSFPILKIDFCTYELETMLDSLPPLIPTLTINGISYSNVYALKMSRDSWPPGNNDVATLYYNRQYGAIQLLLPSGKTITRTN